MCPSSGENYFIYATLVFLKFQPADQTPPTQSDKYQRRIAKVIFSWWWAHGWPKYVEKLNKYIKQNCATSWLYLQNYTGMHGQQKKYENRTLSAQFLW